MNTNVEAARAEIQSLNGLNTSSTHTIYVRKVEGNATGGLVGESLPQFAFVLRKAAVQKYGGDTLREADYTMERLCFL